MLRSFGAYRTRFLSGLLTSALHTPRANGTEESMSGTMLIVGIGLFVVGLVFAAVVGGMLGALGLLSGIGLLATAVISEAMGARAPAGRSRDW